MLHNASPTYTHLFDEIARLPVVDTHEHTGGFPPLAPRGEPISQIMAGYLPSDLANAGLSLREAARLADPEIATQQKWPFFERAWRRTEHTAYARVVKLALRDFYGQEKMSLVALEALGERLQARTAADYGAEFAAAGIRAILVDALHWRTDTVAAYIDGNLHLPDHMRLMIPLRLFHVVPRADEPTMHDAAGLNALAAWSHREITCLDDFLEAVYDVLQRFLACGAAGLKDQSAYVRPLDYQPVARSDAERIFNRLLGDPRSVFGWPEAKPLDDFLFHRYMRFARELNLPVQLHTGHMAGVYNRVDKANAARLAPVLELHRSVKFDLFHANWPYEGDLLFLVKNYPNVALDMCWAPIIDPFYCVDLLRRSVGAIPHVKVHAFGGDHVDTPEFSIAHLKLTRACIASALADLVDHGWLDEGQALTIATDWLYNNPNEFFCLGLPALGSAVAEANERVV